MLINFQRHVAKILSCHVLFQVYDIIVFSSVNAEIVDHVLKIDLVEKQQLIIVKSLDSL
jgi:hypothetical protein